MNNSNSSDSADSGSDCECDYCTKGELETIRLGTAGKLLLPITDCPEALRAHLDRAYKTIDETTSKFLRESRKKNHRSK